MSLQAVVDLVGQQAAAKLQKGHAGRASQKAAQQAEAAVPNQQPALRLGLAWQVHTPHTPPPPSSICYVLTQTTLKHADVCPCRDKLRA